MTDLRYRAKPFARYPRASWPRFPLNAIVLLVLSTLFTSCFGAPRIKEISTDPYPVINQDDSTVRFGDPDDNVFIEVRRAKTSRAIENLAIQYNALFPGGEPIRPGDTEEYVKLGGRNAYRVSFKPKYIRKRKRIGDDEKKAVEAEASDWKTVKIHDPETGKQVPVLYGPVIPRERLLYLVAGDSEVYAIFMRADGDAVGPAKKRFDKFVREEIAYK